MDFLTLLFLFWLPFGGLVLLAAGAEALGSLLAGARSARSDKAGGAG